jgi:hypothetical protein
MNLTVFGGWILGLLRKPHQSWFIRELFLFWIFSFECRGNTPFFSKTHVQLCLFHSVCTPLPHLWHLLHFYCTGSICEPALPLWLETNVHPIIKATQQLARSEKSLGGRFQLFSGSTGSGRFSSGDPLPRLASPFVLFTASYIFLPVCSGSSPPSHHMGFFLWWLIRLHAGLSDSLGTVFPRGLVRTCRIAVWYFSFALAANKVSDNSVLLWMQGPGMPLGRCYFIFRSLID